ncbi:MAG: tyrosine-type recombinase/integrase [Phycisphaerales bacterium]
MFSSHPRAVASLVGTTLNEPDVMWKRYTTTGVYPDLDVFNRVTSSRWTKDLATDRDFVDLDIAYDRNSNITRVVDNVHTTGLLGAGNGLFDAGYSIDDLNRLFRAQEGNWTGSVIDNQTRDEQWRDATPNAMLTQTGNWERYRLNLNGDADFTDAGELDEDRTHNVANELTGRDTDDNGSDNYTLTYDANGNLTDDGKDYEYVYDAFGRVRQAKRTDNQAVVAAYRYNGLGFRISYTYDTDPDAERLWPLPDMPRLRVLVPDLVAAGLAPENELGVIDFHSFRHQFVTRLVRSAMPIRAAQTLARHSDPKLTLNVYAHLTLADERAALEQAFAPRPASAARATGTHG